jgi:hypothetical protein
MHNTTFQFSLKEATEVELTVYDMFGKLMLTVTQDRYESGRHEIICQTNQLPSGHYVLRFRTTSGENRAMLLKL